MQRGPIVALVPLALFAFANTARANQYTATQIDDNTLYQTFGDIVGTCFGDASNGAGRDIFAGLNGEGEERRAVLRFDLGAIPAGSTITAVTLTLNVNKVAGAAQGPETFGLHRLTASWGEGTSNANDFPPGFQGGDGAPASPTDATWCDRFFGTAPWTTEGGDFDPASSGATDVGTSFPAAVTWGSTAGMVADVQGWVDSPASNDGWILVDDGAPARPAGAGGVAVQGVSPTARRFDSSEGPTPELRPQLVVTFTTQGITAVPTASPWMLALLGCLLAAAALWVIARPR